ncbi:MAG: PHP domain-containing protein [Candidatus Eisenbacteria bacterium]|uniref:PHP domain-containing protein n=1 Tax=Eiseniibacteriota bacterium TaxID=2212470 RepID=A0A538TB84_UNCEI|nr:MAG: PHP domain-containing protein [Candidatus Eisenbacteria bacterium]
MSRIDLHMHSSASDGSFTPDAVTRTAASNGVEIFSLTDHDTLDGLPAAALCAKQCGLRLIPGVELSVSEEAMDVHLLAYGFDETDPTLGAAVARYREGRRERARKILSRLKGLGIRISLEEIETIAHGGSLGRPHVAEALLRAGHVESFNEAFQRYLGHHAPAYVPKPRVTLEEASTIVRDAGGVTILAHPGTLNRDYLIPAWARRGLDGIEVWHSKHDAAAVERYRGFAQLHGLLMTGGSDYHGERTPGITIGSVEVPDEILKPLDALLKTRRPVRSRS